MIPAQDKQLISYFASRKVWLVKADEGAATLRSYSLPSDQAAPGPGRPGNRRGGKVWFR